MRRRIKSILIVLVCTLLTSAGQILIKLGVNRITTLASALNIYVITGLVIYLGAAALLITALKHADLSLVYPLIATSFIWVSLLSASVLKEPLSIINWTGIGFIVVGVSCIGRS